MEESIDPTPTLGTLLRRLLAHLDGAVEAAYADAGLDYRPRFTPIVRALVGEGPATLRTLSGITGVSHSAISQTVAEMARAGLVATAVGPRDARARLVELTPFGHALVDDLRRHWAATNAAARSLDRELSAPLSVIAAEALDALARKSFAARIDDAASRRPSRSPSKFRR